MGNRRVGPISKKAMVYRWCKTYRLKSFSLFNRLSVLFNYFETNYFLIYFLSDCHCGKINKKSFVDMLVKVYAEGIF